MEFHFHCHHFNKVFVHIILGNHWVIFIVLLPLRFNFITFCPFGFSWKIFAWSPWLSLLISCVIRWWIAYETIYILNPFSSYSCSKREEHSKDSQTKAFFFLCVSLKVQLWSRKKRHDLWYIDLLDWWCVCWIIIIFLQGIYKRSIMLN